jgi:tRNA threonylcarbamoyladenosine biosynthesis protein TsaE
MAAIMVTERITLETEGAGQTRALGARLGQLLAVGDVLALAGDLGAGKTTFVQGVAASLGITAAVTSPTFVLVNSYRLPNGARLQHADCYRLKDAPLEMWDIGLTDLFAGDDIVVIEWADRIPGLLPDEHLAILFEYVDDEHRRLTFRAAGPRYVAMLHRLERLTV